MQPLTRRCLIATGVVALGVVAAIFFFPYKAILSVLLDSRLRRAEIAADWGSVRYAFPRSLVLAGSSFRVNWEDRPVEVRIDRATITPYLSCLWGTRGAHVEAEMGGGTVLIDAEEDTVRTVRFIVQSVPLDRLPTRLLLPWDLRGVAQGSGAIHWTGSLITAEGTLKWESPGTEYRGVRWLGVNWPPIRADRSEGKITLAARQLIVDFRSTGGNCPFEAAGTLSLHDQLNESPVDFDVRIRPAPEMMASLGDTGVQFERARTVEGVVTLEIAGPLETAETQIR